MVLVPGSLALAAVVAFPQSHPASAPAPETADLVRVAVAALLSMEEKGEWPYEGVYRVPSKDGPAIPMGYRVGGTAIVATALLHAGDPKDTAASAARDRALSFVLGHLDDDVLAPSTVDVYDVRVWGQAYALELLSHVSSRHAAGARAKPVAEWIPRLVSSLEAEQLDDGGWNYAGRAAQASFVTAPVVQALLFARAAGATVKAKTFQRAKAALVASRTPQLAFTYSGAFSGRSNDRRALVPGAIGRSPIAASTLFLLGAGSVDEIQKTIDDFHDHWEELDARRQKPGTHEGPYGVAPYYFQYGHRYAAQAIELLPEGARAKERSRLREKLLRTRDDDGTWNDRVFPRSRNLGTAMAVLALLGREAPLPPPLEERAAK
ncbi:MAG TPA: hypothetical protein VKE69_12640 [Planctomycetota bacterium]|nr:hypothetical protein [Planctomycetota bacterium]